MSFIASITSFCLGLAIGIGLAGRRFRRQDAASSGIAPDGELTEATSLGRIAHELKSPLAALQSAIDVQGRALARLETDSNAPEYRAAARALTTSRAAVGQIEELADAMRSVGRLGQLARQATPARGLVDAALLLVGHRFTSIEVERNDVSGVRLHVIPGEIVRVLVNLLVNASRALPDGGRVRILTRSSDAWGEIQIEDSGPGIPPEDEERIFLPGHTSWTTGARGEGHGLALAREAVERNDGDLRLVNGDLGGAAFIVRLPLADSLAESRSDSHPDSRADSRSNSPSDSPSDSPSEPSR